MRRVFELESGNWELGKKEKSMVHADDDGGGGRATRSVPVECTESVEVPPQTGESGGTCVERRLWMVWLEEASVALRRG